MSLKFEVGDIVKIKETGIEGKVDNIRIDTWPIPLYEVNSEEFIAKKLQLVSKYTTHTEFKKNDRIRMEPINDDMFESWEYKEYRGKLGTILGRIEYACYFAVQLDDSSNVIPCCYLDMEKIDKPRNVGTITIFVEKKKY